MEVQSIIFSFLFILFIFQLMLFQLKIMNVILIFSLNFILLIHHIIFVLNYVNNLIQKYKN